MDSDRACGVYVSGIDETTTEAELSTVFSAFGQITEVFLKAQRRWAIVQFTSVESAQSAVAANVTTIGYATVEVALRTPPKEKEVVPDSVNIYLNGLDESVTEEQIVAALGTVVSVEVHGDRGFAYATMPSIEDAAQAVAAAPLIVGGLSGVGCEMRMSKPRGPKQRKKKASRTRAPKDLSLEIYVKGLTPESPEASNKDELRAIFEAYGNVTRVTVRNERDFAFVSFDDAASAQAAVEGSSGGVTVNGASVIVECRTGKVARAPAPAAEYYE